VNLAIFYNAHSFVRVLRYFATVLNHFMIMVAILETLSAILLQCYVNL
jgi:hypothetical protein